MFWAGKANTMSVKSCTLLIPKCGKKINALSIYSKEDMLHYTMENGEKRSMQEQQSKLALYSIPAVFRKHPLLRTLWRFGFHLLLSCGIIWMLLGWMFLFAKGPAYIFFDESSKHSDLSKLHSQSICLSADTVIADIEDGAQINTQIYGRSIALSASALRAL